jgi:hypothetical protein
MSQTEALAYLALALAGAAYWAYNNQAGLTKYLSVDSTPPVKPPADTWRSNWVQTLMSLQTDLEEEGADNCVPLVRELVWRLLGGEPSEVRFPPPKK